MGAAAVRHEHSRQRPSVECTRRELHAHDARPGDGDGTGSSQLVPRVLESLESALNILRETPKRGWANHNGARTGR